MDELSLSVIIPAYNEEARIARRLGEVLGFLRQRGGTFEVCVVDDGSTDGTLALMHQLARDAPELVVLCNPTNRGKGAAIRRGVRVARGQYVLFTDADQSCAIAEVEGFLPWFVEGFDVIIGSRDMPGEGQRGSGNRSGVKGGY